MRENPKEKFEIGRCLVFPVYGYKNTKDLFLRIRDCEQRFRSSTKTGMVRRFNRKSHI